ncbi:MAG: glycosyltransferase family 39 protein, partial [Acidobacteriota bacterium]
WFVPDRSGRDVDRKGQALTPSRLRMTLILGVAATLLYLAVLGRVGFRDPDEGRYASIGAAMAATGDWILPRLVGLPYLEKPPLLYWMIGASVKALGRSEFAARLPSAVAALLGLCGIFLLGWRGCHWRTGVLAVVVLATSPGYAFMSQFVSMDMLVTACITLALVCFYLGCVAHRPWLHPTAFLFMAMGTMAKGLIGFLLPGLVMGAFLLFTQGRRGLFRLHHRGALVLIPIMVLPWFVQVQMEHPSFARFFLVEQHFSRFISPTAEHRESFFFFLPILVFGLFPWSGLVPLAIRRGGPRWKDPLERFLWTWAGVIFMFFTLSRGKLAPYILPVLPPLALLVARRRWVPQHRSRIPQSGIPVSGRRMSVDHLSRRPGRLQGLRWACLATAVVMLAAAVLLPLFLPALLGKAGRVPPISVAPQAAALVVSLGSGALMLFGILPRGRPISWFAVLVGVGIALFLAVFSIRKAVEPYIGPRALAMAVRKEIRPEDRILLYGLAQPSFEFYTGRIPFMYRYTGELAFGRQLEPQSGRFINGQDALDQFLQAGPGRVYCVIRKIQAGEFLRRLRQPVRVVAWNAKRVIFSTVGPRDAAVATQGHRIIVAGDRQKLPVPVAAGHRGRGLASGMPPAFTGGHETVSLAGEGPFR